MGCPGVASSWAVGTEGEVGGRNCQLPDPGLGGSGWARQPSAPPRSVCRAPPGCTWAPTSPSPPSPSGAAARCGPWRGTALPSTGAPCPPPSRLVSARPAGRVSARLQASVRSAHTWPKQPAPAAGTARIRGHSPARSCASPSWPPARQLVVGTAGCPAGPAHQGPAGWAPPGWPRSAHSQVATPRRTASAGVFLTGCLDSVGPGRAAPGGG